MLTTALVALSFFWGLILWLSRRNRGDLDKIPGPRRTLIGALFRAKENNPYKNHMNFARLREKYGPVAKTTQAGRTIIVVSDYESIYQVLITSGKQFGDRSSSFVTREVFRNTGILFSTKPDEKWKLLRKVSQKHLKQFGDGMSKLESVITEVAEDMFGDFRENAGKHFDPQKSIFDTALNSIAFLITGQRMYAGDQLIEHMREYENLILRVGSIFAPKHFQLLVHFPFLKYLGFDNWEPYKRFHQLHEDLWRVVKLHNEENPDAKSICSVLNEHVRAQGEAMSESDAQVGTLALLFAGVVTTSTTFVSAINILAHRQDVQAKMYEESQKIQHLTGHAPTLTDKTNMPYTRAVLYETLRYTTVVANGVSHRTREKVTLKGYMLPVGTIIQTSLWNLHHEESFWKNPNDFQPERFLDEFGELVPADHPNRKHLMPFGAGLRVCLGESLAMARLFLWLATLSTRFLVTPAPSNYMESTDPRRYKFTGVLKPDPYQVIFKERVGA